MPWAVDHDLSFICMSVSNFSHFRHPHQSRILLLKVSDGAETWWKASGQHGDLELLKCFKSHLLLKGKSD